MRYRTRQLGVVEVAKDKVLCFVAPLLGFESFRKYALLPVPGARPFFCLQSLEEPQLAFPVVRADELAIEYPLSPDDLRRVAATSRDEIDLLGRRRPAGRRDAASPELPRPGGRQREEAARGADRRQRRVPHRPTP